MYKNEKILITYHIYIEFFSIFVSNSSLSPIIVANSLCEELSKDICQISEGASDLCVFFVGDVAAAHGTEVGRFELTVDKSAPEFAKPGGEVDEVYIPL